MNPLRRLVRALHHTLNGKPNRARRRNPTNLSLTSLEDRAVPAALLVRSIDGSGNNQAHVSWGQAGTDFIRIALAEYSDGISAPAGTDRPDARTISNSIADANGQNFLNSRSMSAMVYAWGQFIDHDVDLTRGANSEAFNVPVPTGDPDFDPSGTGTQVIPLSRSASDPATGTSVANPRQQVNDITTWLDGSMVYGSDAATAASLRTMQGGKLKTSTGNLLPTSASGQFLAGDVRANENPELTSLQTLFVREHNRIADQIARQNPRLSDEQIYQQARSQVIAELQAITYNEWLPALLGPGAIGPYKGYNAAVNPGISNEFAAAAFRFGHSIVGDDIEFLGNNGEEVAPSVSLAEAFFNPSIVQANGIDSILKYLASDPSQELDTKVVDSLRNLLIASPGSTMALDLASLNIQRGRDHGLSDYNATREAYGLSKVTSFAQITSNTELQAKLKSLYGSVDNIDLWVGLLSEDHVPGGSVGVTTRAIIVDQFSRLRDGDRFWYENTFKGPQLNQLQHTSLTDVIKRNTGVSNLQQNAFFFKASISGSVFTDANKDGKFNPGEPVASNKPVQLVNSDGEIVASSTTDAKGRYQFNTVDGLTTGTYRVQTLAPDGSVLAASKSQSITRGDTNLSNADIAVPKATPPATNPPPKPGGPGLPPPPKGGPPSQSPAPNPGQNFLPPPGPKDATGQTTVPPPVNKAFSPSAPATSIPATPALPVKAPLPAPQQTPPSNGSGSADFGLLSVNLTSPPARPKPGT